MKYINVQPVIVVREKLKSGGVLESTGTSLTFEGGNAILTEGEYHIANIPISNIVDIQSNARVRNNAIPF